MSAQDLAGVGGLAYNPTPLGFGLGLAGAVLGGGRKHIPKIPSYKDGQYYLDTQEGLGPQLMNTSRYQIQGDLGKYDLLPILGGKHPGLNGLLDLFGEDLTAKNLFSQRFPQTSGFNNSFGMVAPANQLLGLNPQPNRLSFNPTTPLLQGRTAPHYTNIGLLGKFAANHGLANGIRFFTPK